MFRFFQSKIKNKEIMILYFFSSLNEKPKKSSARANNSSKSIPSSWPKKISGYTYGNNNNNNNNNEKIMNLGVLKDLASLKKH